MIEVTELTKRCGGLSGTAAVDGLTFRVRPGRVTGFLGPNGAGKSTTLRLLLGMDRPTSGTATIAGRPYAELPEPLRTAGALLEGGGLHPGRTARGHLDWIARSNRIPGCRVGEVIEQTGLGTAADRRLHGFSLGMRQRLGLAAALLGDPRVLLLDEPVNGLDPEGVVWIRELLREQAAKGCAVLVSSHLMAETALAADHLVVIGRGRLLADTGMAEFIERNARSFVRIRTPEPERMRDALTTAGLFAETGPDGAIEVPDGTPERIGELVAEHRVTVHEVALRTASLEEAFMRLTAESTEYHPASAVTTVGETGR
jgi:ABC-2 type transport system ATP-binding protein